MSFSSQKRTTTSFMNSSSLDHVCKESVSQKPFPVLQQYRDVLIPASYTTFVDIGNTFFQPAFEKKKYPGGGGKLWSQNSCYDRNWPIEEYCKCWGFVPSSKLKFLTQIKWDDYV